ncbi:MAG: caspase family protein, partial [Burkholderiaceae bacterium]
NNPYASNFRSASNGLSKVNAPSGTLISFATRPGSVAADGGGTNGIYTDKLLSNMDLPIPIEQVLKNVVSSVRAATKGRQEPWMEGSIEGDFYFVPGAASLLDLEKERKAQEVAIKQAMETLRKTAERQEAQQQGTPAAGINIELSYWDNAKKSGDKSDFELYLKKYPNGYFAEVAAMRIAALQREEDARNKKTQAPTEPATNRFGFAVGDRYSMRHIDKNIRGSANTNEIVIGAIQKDDSLVSADKLVTLRANGTPRRMANPDGTFTEWSDTYVDRIAPEDLIVGYRKDVSWICRYQRAEGSMEETHNGTIEVVGIETVKVPAGQFKAYKIVRRTKFNGEKKWLASGQYYGILKVTNWFVPSIRAIVASDIEINGIYQDSRGVPGYNGIGSLPDRYRDELVSYQVANNQIAQNNNALAK